MNRKTINKILCRKHDKFLESIEDPKIKELIDKNSIISGGAITSMLLNTKVNDFDYYFTNEETAFEVAKHFVEKFKERTKNSSDKVKIYVEREGGRVKVNVKSAGLAAEDNNNSTYKYFEYTPNSEGSDYVEEMTKFVGDLDDIDAKEVEEKLVEKKKKYRPIFMTSNAITLSDKVQLVIRFFGNPEEIHKNYDFVHCTNYWVSKERKLYLNQNALESTLAKHLFYCGSLYPLASIIRTRKFIKRGWHINAGQFVKMCFQLSLLDLTNIDVLDDQLTGVDSAYFYEIIDWFKKQKDKDESFEITLPYLVSIIDKIF